jgi:hypothetical protein
MRCARAGFAVDKRRNVQVSDVVPSRPESTWGLTPIKQESDSSDRILKIDLNYEFNVMKAKRG